MTFEEWWNTKDYPDCCLLRCKRAFNEGRAELEKENAELKKEVEKHKWNDIFLEDCTGYDKKIAEEYTTLQERIKELEKENAELKETLKTYNGCGDWDNDFHTCRVYLQHEELQMYINQLTKAKKILEELANMEYVINPPVDKIRSLMVKTEQFLKGENIILEDAQAGNSPFDAEEVFKKEMKAYPEEKGKKEIEK